MADFDKMGVPEEWARKNPLKVFKFTHDKEMMMEGTSGRYFEGEKVLHIHSNYDNQLGEPWMSSDTPTSPPIYEHTPYSVTGTARTESEALRRVFVHEYSHHIHASTPGIDGRIVRDFRFSKGDPITLYASTAPHEYFAESHSAYIYEPAKLRQRDPTAYELVEWVREKAGLPQPHRKKK